MEMTITLIIKFVMGIQILLASFFIFFEFTSGVNFISSKIFRKFYKTKSFSFSNPSRRFCE